LVSPDKFIPIAEETGTIVSIGEWLMVVACEAAVEWNKQRDIPFKVAINVSTRQFFHNDFLTSVKQVLESSQCKPEWIKLEITESLLLKDDSQIVSTLKALHEMGIHISIDDFGTGYSALSYLNRFPVSQIKIDQSFVFDTPNDRDKSELVKAMINIAQSLRLDVIAEGVETLEQAAYLQEHGCFVAQGYLYGKPMPRSQFDDALHQSRMH
jgi:EAL domain-containing protein (putative c-di-GMP-specific phosphodiesterase class I)